LKQKLRENASNGVLSNAEISVSKKQKENGVKFVDNTDYPEEKEKDPYSCQYCEEVYRIIIFQNVPVKMFKCYYCHSMINPQSLNYYYKKYEKELNQIENLRKSTEASSEIKKSVEVSSPTKDAKIVPKRSAFEASVDNPITNSRKENDNVDIFGKEKETNKIKKERNNKDIVIEDQGNSKALAKSVIIEEKTVEKKAKAQPKEIENKASFEETKVNKKRNIIVEESKEPEKVVNFDKDWVKWNQLNNAEKIENHRKNKELIEINVTDENNDLRGSSLAEAFKKKKGDLIKKFEKHDTPIKADENTLLNENTVIDDKRNSKNHTKSDMIDETNVTKSDFKNTNETTIGEILNDSELKPVKTESNQSKKDKNDKKSKFTNTNNILVKEGLSPNEPSKELLDRLIYGKKAELGDKEIKDVNKRLYAKLIENKEKIQEEENLKKKQEMQKNKEKLKSYSENLLKNIKKK